MGEELNRLDQLRLQYNVYRQMAAAGQWESEQEDVKQPEVEAWLKQKAWAESQANETWQRIKTKTGEEQPVEIESDDDREIPEEVVNEVEPEEPADDFVFEMQPKVLEKSHDSVKVTFGMNDLCKAYITYGEKGGQLDKRTSGEDSFKWKTHIQSFHGLKPDTDYQYQAHTEDGDGNTESSDVCDVKTDKAPAQPVHDSTPAPGWPANADESLPMSGILYGATHGGLQTGNTTLAIEHSFRFRAEKSGYLKGVRWENRLLTQSNIDHRTSPDFKNCQQNNLSPNVCSYTLGNAYHVGSGGRIVPTVHPDNGRGWPNESVTLGKTAKMYVPADHKASSWPTQYMEKPIKLQAGKIYHIMLKNLAPPTGKLYRNTNAQAKAMDPNRGAISLNGVWHGDYVGDQSIKWGPYFGRMGQGALFRNATKGAWKENGQTFPMIEMLWDDGEWTGNVVTGYDNIQHKKAKVRYAKQEGYKVVEGNHRARQVFTAQDADRTINGLWLSFQHTRTANMQPITATLKDSGGKALVTGQIAASRAVLNKVHAGLKDPTFRAIGAINANTWGYTDLSRTVLKKGQTYYLELNAPAGAGFHINSFFPMHNANGGNRNEWTHAKAEYFDGKWGPYDRGNGRAERDLPVMFTLEGMPKKLP